MENRNYSKSLKIRDLQNIIQSHWPSGTPPALDAKHQPTTQSSTTALVTSSPKSFTSRRQTMTTIKSQDNAAQKHDDIPADLLELTQAIEQLPIEHRIRLLPSLRRVTESSVRRRRILTLVQEALGQLRLDMKYLVFDLEATRRERDEFLQKLNDLGGCQD